MCSGSEAGSYLKLIDFCTKKRKTKKGPCEEPPVDDARVRGVDRAEPVAVMLTDLCIILRLMDLCIILRRIDFCIILRLIYFCGRRKDMAKSPQSTMPVCGEWIARIPWLVCKAHRLLYHSYVRLIDSCLRLIDFCITRL